jgi:eukaryotic-like serine/threonine-protein kinase
MVSRSARGYDARVAPSAGTLSVGARVGPWTLTELLGRGAQGEVWKARRGDELAAVKVMLQGGGEGDRARARFEREATTAAALEHEGIVRVLDHGEQDGRPWYAMAHVEGQSLERRLAQAPLDPVDAARVVARVARAVQYAHDRGVVHRDLKPSNIILAGGALERPRVIDFGLAFVEGQERLTKGNAFVGTPCYLAPELIHGALASPASDVYALGAILYECVVGRPPFIGGSVGSILERTLHATPIRPRKLKPHVPGALERVCFQCLEKVPTHRPPTAASVARALERLLGERRQESLAVEARETIAVAGAGLRRTWPYLVGLALGLEAGFLAGVYLALHT